MCLLYYNSGQLWVKISEENEKKLTGKMGEMMKILGSCNIIWVSMFNVLIKK